MKYLLPIVLLLAMAIPADAGGFGLFFGGNGFNSRFSRQRAFFVPQQRFFVPQRQVFFPQRQRVFFAPQPVYVQPNLGVQSFGFGYGGAVQSFGFNGGYGGGFQGFNSGSCAW